MAKRKLRKKPQRRADPLDYTRVSPNVPLLPCPCCGNKNLSVGAGGQCSVEIRCIDLTREVADHDDYPGCRLKLSRSLLEKTPRRLVGKTAHQTMKNLYQDAMDRAAAAWNRRANG